MSLPTLKFILPEWQSSDFKLLERNKKRMVAILEKTGKGSDKFVEACERIKRLVFSKHQNEIPKVIKSTVDVRALAYLIGQQKDFHDHIELSKEILESLYRPRNKIGRISLLQLIRAFFRFFDQIGSEGVFKYLCKLLQHELAHYERDSTKDHGFGALVRYRKILFTSKGPALVVDVAKECNTDLDFIFKEMSLEGYHDSRFHNLCRYQYYLDTLKELPIGEDHPVLTEVCKAEVFNAPSGEGSLLGHQILSILIDRAKENISDVWRSVVLTIAGDPRVPESNTRFQKWWAILGKQRVLIVRGWLSKFDLLLFLDALKDFGETSGNTDLLRMFRARKIFLEGLEKQGLIENSRLIIGTSAERYLKAHYKKDELPEYANLRESARSIIYLRIGHCHMIEGSHSFKLWLFPKIPSGSGLENYTCSRYRADDLSYKLEQKYLKEFQSNYRKPESVIHHPNVTWQAAAIKFLKSEGIHLDVEKLFTPEDYRQYKRKFGL